MDREVANAIMIAGRAIGDGLGRIGEALKMQAAIRAKEHDIRASEVRDWLREYSRR